MHNISVCLRKCIGKFTLLLSSSAKNVVNFTTIWIRIGSCLRKLDRVLEFLEFLEVMKNWHLKGEGDTSWHLGD